MKISVSIEQYKRQWNSWVEVEDGETSTNSGPQFWAGGDRNQEIGWHLSSNCWSSSSGKRYIQYPEKLRKYDIGKIFVHELYQSLGL